MAAFAVDNPNQLAIKVDQLATALASVIEKTDKLAAKVEKVIAYLLHESPSRFRTCFVPILPRPCTMLATACFWRPRTTSCWPYVVLFSQRLGKQGAARKPVMPSPTSPAAPKPVTVSTTLPAALRPAPAMTPNLAPVPRPQDAGSPLYLEVVSGRAVSQHRQMCVR
ncbi:hypothetical protein BCR44DRAFT_394058 [Catenaria anguillulae PL171]|uniref:Uncharacterized protein n=1 Tax=Catenaria anguillulae PL171 TaxID=765915 RepID=A0A1Y2H211_9FUNG|nr:hypothetical protein BCR44DRAFT_394058 [Catenaria anguillulae PL171]